MSFGEIMTITVNSIWSVGKKLNGLKMWADCAIGLSWHSTKLFKANRFGNSGMIIDACEKISLNASGLTMVYMI